MDWMVERAAKILLAREESRCDGGRFTDEWPELDLPTAYRVQDELIARKQKRGQRVVGVKLGLTSRAKQRTMGIDSPLTAWLTDAMNLPAGMSVPIEELIHPRVEPEIVLVLGERLAGPGVRAAQALQAVPTVLCGFEVIDSRYADFQFRLPDVVADNASSSRFVVNPTGSSAAGPDMALEACCRWAARWSTPPPALQSKATPSRRSRWPRTRSPSAAMGSRPAAKCSPEG
jgi:2-oxo-3-hexenedioate decarboxylase